MTIADLVKQHAERTPDAVAMREKHRGIWREITWRDYWGTAETVARALRSLGVQPGDRVAIQSENRSEWLFVDVATVAVRAATVGLYPTNPPDEVRHMLADSGARILFAEDQEQVDKALDVLDDCPDLEWIVYLEPRGVRGRYQHPKLISWSDLLASHADDGPIELRSENDDVATLIYTSGTTGRPKGAMLTVANVDFAIRVLVEGGGFADPPPGPRRPDPVLPAAVPRRGAGLHGLVQRGRRGHRPLRGVDRDGAGRPARGPADDPVRGAPHLGEDDGRRHRPARRGVADQTLNARLWLRVADRVGATLEANGGRHTAGSRLLYTAGWLLCYRALKERIGLRRVRYAASGAARSLRTCCGSSWASGCRCTRSTA